MLSRFVQTHSRPRSPFTGVLLAASLILTASVGLSGCGGSGGTQAIVNALVPSPVASVPVNVIPSPPVEITIPRQTNPTSTVTRARFAVEWEARSRPGTTRALPSSAVSIALTFPEAASRTGDVPVRIVVNRDPARPAAYRADYTGDKDILTGVYSVIVTAYAEPDGTGSIVGAGLANVTIASDGTGLGTLATDRKVAATFVDPSESLTVGDSRLLRFGASDAQGNVLLLTPGSAFFELASGANILRLDPDQSFTALRPGDATLTVTVDNVKSVPQTVRVVSGASVSVTPTTLRLATRDRRKLTAVVEGAPAGEAGVVWSVLGGAGSGTIDADGNYTSPVTPGSYDIVATSRYDPSKSATVTATVVGDGETIPVDPSLTGDLPVVVQ